eukprot:111693_1
MSLRCFSKVVARCRINVNVSCIRRMVTQVNDKTELNQLLTKSTESPNELFVIAYFAEWCRICHRIAPEVEEMSEDYEDYNVTFLKFKCDGVGNEMLCQSRDIKALPAFEIIRNGTFWRTYPLINWKTYKLRCTHS